jgi:hypothetical protein
MLFARSKRTNGPCLPASPRAFPTPNGRTRPTMRMRRN